MSTLRARSLLPSALVCVLVGACGGGGGGGGSAAIEGLLPPGQISVVNPAGEAALPPNPPNFAPNSDYELDETRAHVYDPAIEPLSMVNMILCLVGQTGADQLVNQAPYLAQVNQTICDSGGDGGTGQSSSVDQFELWTVDSTRSAGSAPQVVHYWVASEDDGEQVTIFVNMLLTRGADDEFPYGEFEIDFVGAADEASIGTPVFGGALSAGQLSNGLSGFRLFFSNGDVNQVPGPGDRAEETAATVVVRADQEGGSARVRTRSRQDSGSGDTGIVTNEYLVSYDSTHFLRALNGDPAQAYERLDFVENVWRYNLYHASGPQAGQRVELSSGFGFRSASGGYGWIGYWGLWTSPGVTIENGDTITRDEYGNAGETYSVFKAPGKLIRNTRRTLPLTELDGQTFQWWWFDPLAGPQDYLVRYDEVAQQWLKIGLRAPDSQSVTPIDPPEVIDTAAVGFLNMWSQGLGGSTAFVHGETNVTYFAQSFVDGSDPVFAGGDLTLYGLVQCLRPGVTGEQAQNGNVFLPDAPDVATPHVFVFPQADLTLYLDTSASGGGLDPVGLAPGEAPASGPYTWGMRSGPMVTSTLGLTSVWDVWNAAEFYVWETGANDWNQFARAVDGQGNFVSFDAPLAFSYVQGAGDDRNGDDSRVGQTYFLNYGGAGQLWGLPQEGRDLNADGSPDRWYPLVNLADGLLLGPGGNEYVLKAIDIEQTLSADPAYTGTLDLAGASALVVPSSTLYTTPALGPQPVVTDPPRVVQGVVVGP